MTSPRLPIPPFANLPNPANSLKWALLSRTGARVGVQMGFMSTLPWGSDAPPCNTCRVFFHFEVRNMMFAIYGPGWDHCMYTTDLGKWVKETPRKAILSLFFFDMPAQSCSAVKFERSLRQSKPRIWVCLPTWYCSGLLKKVEVWKTRRKAKSLIGIKWDIRYWRLHSTAPPIFRGCFENFASKYFVSMVTWAFMNGNYL